MFSDNLAASTAASFASLPAISFSRISPCLFLSWVVLVQFQYRMEFGIKMKNGINGMMGCGRVTVW